MLLLGESSKNGIKLSNVSKLATHTPQCTKMGGQGLITHFFQFKYFKNYLKSKKSKNISIHETLFLKF